MNSPIGSTSHPPRTSSNHTRSSNSKTKRTRRQSCCKLVVSVDKGNKLIDTHIELAAVVVYKLGLLGQHSKVVIFGMFLFAFVCLFLAWRFRSKAKIKDFYSPSNGVWGLGFGVWGLGFG